MKQINNNDSSNYQNDEIDLIEIFLVLWKKKIFIILISLILTIAVGTFLYFFVPKTYKSTLAFNNIALPISGYQALKNTIVSNKFKKQIIKKLPSELKDELSKNPNFPGNIINITSYPELTGKRKEEISKIDTLYISLDNSQLAVLNDFVKIVQDLVFKNLLLKNINIQINSRINNLQKDIYDISKQEISISKTIPIEKDKLKAIKNIKNNSKPTYRRHYFTV